MKISFLISFLIFLEIKNSIYKIDSAKKHFIDDKGRVKIFHGVNVVFKLPPYLPTIEIFDSNYSLNEVDMEYMKQFGFNVVRLGIIWEAVEISPNVYDYEYLDKIEKIINMLGENGIAVVLDSHQDMFSRLFCGEGVPMFYAREMSHDNHCDTNMLSKILQLAGACLPLKTFNWRYDDDVPKLEDCKNFFEYHLSPELSTVYQSFYDNENGIQDKFAAYWKVLATKFSSNKYILGYDIWNEPWVGNLWQDIRSLWPGYSDHHQILPMYRKIDSAIREVNPDFISMFQSSPFPNTLPFFGGKVVGGFYETPAGPQYNDRQVLNMHQYCCAARYDVCANGEPTLEDAEFCQVFHQHKIGKHQQQAQELGIPFILTEFGACSDTLDCYKEIRGVVDAAEDNLVSWMYWNYKHYGDHTTTANREKEGVFYNNTAQDIKMKGLTGTFIQSYQGQPLLSKFNPENGDYKSRFIYDPKVIEPSVLYLHKEYFYRNGFKLTIKNDEGNELIATIIEDGNYISFKLAYEYVEFVNVYIQAVTKDI